MEKLQQWWHRFIVWRFMRLGSKLFRVVSIWQEPAPGEDECQPDDPVKAIHFAQSDRDLNTSMRCHVEELDNE